MLHFLGLEIYRSYTQPGTNRHMNMDTHPQSVATHGCIFPHDSLIEKTEIFHNYSIMEHKANMESSSTDFISYS